MSLPDPDFLQSTEERMEHIAELTLLSLDAMRDALAHLHSLTASLRSPNDNDDDDIEIRPSAERDVRLRLAMSAVVLESTQGRVRTQHRSLLRLLRNAQQPLDHHHQSQPHNTLPTTRSNPAAVNVLPRHSHARAPDYYDEREHADAASPRRQQQQSARDCDVAAELVASVTTVYRELFSHLAEDLLSVLQPSSSSNDEVPPPHHQQQQERGVRQSSSKGSCETCVGPPPSQMDKKSG